MRPFILTFLFLFGLTAVQAHAENPVYSQPAKAVKARVEILATHSSVLQTFAGGQQTYIADVEVNKAHFVAILIDRYPVWNNAIRTSILVADQPLSMRLTRDEACDQPAHAMGMPMGNRLVYSQSFYVQIAKQESTTLPCYLIDHQQTRLAK